MRCAPAERMAARTRRPLWLPTQGPEPCVSRSKKERRGGAAGIWLHRRLGPGGHWPEPGDDRTLCSARKPAQARRRRDLPPGERRTKNETKLETHLEKLAVDVPARRVNDVDSLGRGDSIRNCDPLLPKQVLYQAELRPEPRNHGPYSGHEGCWERPK